MVKAMTAESKGVGLPPGSLVFVGEKRTAKPTITVIDYSRDTLEERVVDTPAECGPFVVSPTATWINLIGLHETDVLRRLGEEFRIHPLVLEDILHLGQRPKLQEHDEYLFVVLNMLYRSEGTGQVMSEQVSLVLGRHHLLSFQEVEGDVFGMIRDRLRTGQGRIRGMGCDYLAYALMDAIVDHYFLVLEEMVGRTEELLQSVLSQPGSDVLEDIHRTRRDMIFMRRMVWPLREVISGLEKSESPLIDDSLRPYLRDLYEHTIQVMDTLESLRDSLSSALDMYMTTVSNRMNEIMKVLTVIATIFIPLTFVAGIYGMNFENMPELKWKWGYGFAWALMAGVAGAMAVYFKRKKWL